MRKPCWRVACVEPTRAALQGCVRLYDADGIFLAWEAPNDEGSVIAEAHAFAAAAAAEGLAFSCLEPAPVSR